jgi:hypothetical protein
VGVECKPFAPALSGRFSCFQVPRCGTAGRSLLRAAFSARVVIQAPEEKPELVEILDGLPQAPRARAK